jgi:hypothetical protein
MNTVNLAKKIMSIFEPDRSRCIARRDAFQSWPCDQGGRKSCAAFTGLALSVSSRFFPPPMRRWQMQPAMHLFSPMTFTTLSTTARD